MGNTDNTPFWLQLRHGKEAISNAGLVAANILGMSGDIAFMLPSVRRLKLASEQIPPHSFEVLMGLILFSYYLGNSPSEPNQIEASVIELAYFGQIPLQKFIENDTTMMDSMKYLRDRNVLNFDEKTCEVWWSNSSMNVQRIQVALDAL